MSDEGSRGDIIDSPLSQNTYVLIWALASLVSYDHMREILENAQYTPTKNLYKIYLIDEVHMLSKSSFNALLKTLEEPPGHIKFLLATTDPKKLPITILSRCLQFNLNKLSHDEIFNHLKFIMNSEGLEFEDDALSKIAEFGNGSMRDALSLLDQSISFGNGSVKDKDIKAMLGLVNHDDIFKLASLVIQRKADEVLLFVRELAHRGENLSNALKDLTSLFHEISIAQMISDDKQISAEIRSLATLISVQDLQLFYQIAINGQKDINYSPSEQIGLEMTLLRMIAFHPYNIDDEKKNLKLPKKKNVKHKANKKISESESLVDIKDSAVKKKIENKNQPSIKNQVDWEKIIYELSFSGAAKTVVKNTLFCSFSAGTITLTLNKEFNNLLTSTTQKSIEKKLGTIVDGISLVIELGETNGSTLSNKEANKLEQEKKQTEDQFLSDGGLKELENAFNSKVDKKSIKSLKESNNV